MLPCRSRVVLHKGACHLGLSDSSPVRLGACLDVSDQRDLRVIAILVE